MFSIRPKSARRAYDRARFLGHEIQQRTDLLGVAGKHFVEWLLLVLEKMEPRTLPADADSHLFLDLYGRESDEIARILKHGVNSLPLDSLRMKRIHTIIVDMMHREMDATERVLSVLDRNTPEVSASRVEFSASKKRILRHDSRGGTFAETTVALLSARTAVSECLGRLPLEACNPEHAENTRETAKRIMVNMVEYSGSCINQLIEHAGYGR